MTPDDAAGLGKLPAQTTVDNGCIMYNDLAERSIRAAMAKSAQILGGHAAGVSFSLRFYTRCPTNPEGINLAMI